MRVLITGSSGFIGTFLLRNEKRVIFKRVLRGLEVSGQNVYSIDRLDSKTNWEGAFEGVDAVLHLAAMNNDKSASIESFDEVNHLGTLNLAKASAQAGVRRFVFLSTSHVLGSCSDGYALDETMKESPQSPYAVSKFAAERSLKSLEKETGMEIVIVRPSFVYGYGKQNNFSKLVDLVKKLPVLPFGFAHKMRSFISVANLADFLYLCLTHPRAKGETFLISDSNVSLRDFTNEIAKGLNKKRFQIPIPVVLFTLIGKLTGKSPIIEQIFGEFQVNSSKAFSLLGWKPIQTMEEAMASLRSR